jgi:uncharacterized membrane protein YfcA
MNNRAVAIAGLVMALLGLIATICLFAFERGIRDVQWINLNAAGLGTAVICLVGCILGWASVKSAPGKAATVMGTILVLFFAYQLFRSEVSRPARNPLPRPQATSLPADRLID